MSIKSLIRDLVLGTNESAQEVCQHNYHQFERLPNREETVLVCLKCGHEEPIVRQRPLAPLY